MRPINSALFTKIGFWILLFFCIRWVGIHYPPIETGHAWRQALTSMIARNFAEVDANIFYPRVNTAGEKEGVFAGEFPFYNYLMFLFGRIFGNIHFGGRLINLIVSSFGVYFYSKLVSRYWGEKVGFIAAWILLFSIWFAFSRKIMPDTFSISLMIMGLYAASLFTDTQKNAYLLLYILLSSLGALCKMPSITLLSAGALWMLASFSTSVKVRIAVSTSMIIALFSLWYFYWQPYLLATYHNQLYFPVSVSEGLKIMKDLWTQLVEKFYFAAFHSYIAFAACVAGVFFVFKDKQKLTMAVAGLITLPFAYFALKTGITFPTHNYYIIPYVPLMALIAAYALSKIQKEKVLWVILAFIAIESIANQQHDFRYNEKGAYILSLSSLADSLTHKNDLVAVASDMNPHQMYFLHRSGWNLPPSMCTDTNIVKSIQSAGCKYLFYRKTEVPELLKYPLIYEDTYYRVYRLP